MKIKNFINTEMGTFKECHGGIGDLDFTELFSSEDFESKIRFFHYTVLPPHTSIGPHKHGNDEEIYIVLEGRGIMRQGEAKYPVEAGSVIVNQTFGEHSIINEEESPLRLLVFEVEV